SQRAVILAPAAYVRPDDLELSEAAGETPQTLHDARDDAERRLLIEVLTRNAGNITRAAREIEVSRPTFHDLLRKHEIDARQYRHPGAPGEGEDEDETHSAEA